MKILGRSLVDFETQSHPVAQSGLDLTMQPRLPSKLPAIPLPQLKSAGTTLSLRQLSKCTIPCMQEFPDNLFPLLRIQTQGPNSCYQAWSHTVDPQQSKGSQHHSTPRLTSSFNLGLPSQCGIIK